MSVSTKTIIGIVVAGIIAIILTGAILFYVLIFLVSTSVQILPVPQTSTARNWAGYLVASDLQNPQSIVLGVNGSWIVPEVTETGFDAFSAVWVGIGGQFDTTLIQTGTEQDIINGSAAYSAWYEMLPQDAVTIDTMQISPGDSMQASITLLNSTDTWLILITDLTNGQSFHNTFSYSSLQSSAEWIVERPTINGQLSELSDFGNVTFTNCSANLNNQTGSITSFANIPIVMDSLVRFGQTMQLTSVSKTSNQGSEFSVAYTG